eukprot:9647606-Ditylum_brightwellii.AAC.1
MMWVKGSSFGVVGLGAGFLGQCQGRACILSRRKALMLDTFIRISVITTLISSIYVHNSGVTRVGGDKVAIAVVVVCDWHSFFVWGVLLGIITSQVMVGLRWYRGSKAEGLVVSFQQKDCFN